MADTSTIEDEEEQVELLEQQNQEEQGRFSIVSQSFNKSKSAVVKAIGTDSSLEEAVILVNSEMSVFLNEIAWWIWGLAIPTFGLSILGGAIAGDLLFLMKNFLVKRALGAISVATLGQGINIKDLSADEIAEKVKFSLSVKTHIVLMNLAIILIAMIILLFATVVMKGLCDGWVSGISLKAAGYGSVCTQIDSIGAPSIK